VDCHDSWAWLEHHYRAHRSQLYGSAIGILRNAHDAEDAIQIALLSAYRALARGDRPLHPRAWLFTIVLNACRRLLKTRAQTATAVGTRDPQAPAPDPDAKTGAEIMRAVASLSAEQREVFTLRELQGLSYSELSETLGVSPVAAESRLSRARRRLREELAVPDELISLPRRRPLLAIPNVLAVMRAMAMPGAIKVAGIVGAVALVPALTVGVVRGDQERPPRAAAHAVISPATGKAQAHVQREPAGPAMSRRPSTPSASTAQTSEEPAPRALPQAAGSAHRASARAAAVGGIAAMPSASVSVQRPATGAAHLPIGATSHSAAAAHRLAKGRPALGAATVTAPSVTAPRVTTTSVTTPSVTAPSVTPPSVTTPSVTVPSDPVPTATVPASPQP
jgi:RNA polymerase sigma-70 factor (ECF subfamily)